MEELQVMNMEMDMENVTPKFAQNPSLSDLEEQLRRERKKLVECSFPNEEERHKVISRIRMLRSSIEMLQGYMQHFMLN